MFSQIQDFVTEQMKAFTGQAQQFGADPLAIVREGVSHSADGLKSLKQPVRVAAKSSVELSTVSQKAFEDLIELQAEIATKALTEMAAGLERVAHAKDVASLVSAQTDALREGAERLVNDANRAREIFTEHIHLPSFWRGSGTPRPDIKAMLMWCSATATLNRPR